MVEMISKWDVVNKLIRLENEYQFHKPNCDAETLYRKICKLEIEIGKTPIVDAVEVVRCKDCKYYRPPFCLLNDNKHGYLNHVLPEHFCAYGERDR